MPSKEKRQAGCAVRRGAVGDKSGIGTNRRGERKLEKDKLSA